MEQKSVIIILLKRCVGQRRTSRYRVGVVNPQGKKQQKADLCGIRKVDMVSKILANVEGLKN